MKKRIFSLLLALWMLVSLVPFSVFADDCGGCGEAACTVCNPVQEPDPQPEPEANSEPEVKPDPQPEPQPEAKPDPQPEPQPEVKEEPKEEPKTEVKEEPEEEPKPEEKEETSPSCSCTDLTKCTESKKNDCTYCQQGLGDCLGAAPAVIVSSTPISNNGTASCICTGSPKCLPEKKLDGCTVCADSIDGCLGEGKQPQDALTITCAETATLGSSITVTVAGGSGTGAYNLTSDNDVTITPVGNGVFTVTPQQAGWLSLTASKEEDNSYAPTMQATYGGFLVPQVTLTAKVSCQEEITKPYDGAFSVNQEIQIELVGLVEGFEDVDPVGITCSYNAPTVSSATSISVYIAGITGSDADCYQFQPGNDLTLPASITKATASLQVKSTNVSAPYTGYSVAPPSNCIEITGAGESDVCWNWRDSSGNEVWPINVGTYTCTPYLEETENYTGATADKMVTLTVTPGTYYTPVSRTVYITQSGQTGTLSADAIFGLAEKPQGLKLTGVSPASGTLMDSVTFQGNAIAYTAATFDAANAPAKGTSETYTVSLDSDNYGNFANVTVTFQYAQEDDIIGIDVTPAGRLVYNGAPQSGYGALNVSPKEATVTLQYTGNDYCVGPYNSDTPPTNAGQYRLTITAEHNGNTATEIVDFRIQAKELAAVSYTLKDVLCSAAGPDLTIQDGDYHLVLGSDYMSFTDRSIDKPGTYSLMIISTTNYIFPQVNTTFKVLPIPADITVEIPGNPSSFPYTGQQVKPSVTVTLADGTTLPREEYDITYGTNKTVGTDTGTITVKPSTDSRYTFTVQTVKFSIGKVDITPEVTVTGKWEYTGTAIQPSGSNVLVQHNGTTLTAGTDYTLSYSDNVNAGTGHVTVSQVNSSSYSFEAKTVDFTIAPKKITAPKITASGNKTYTGLAIEPTVMVYDGSTKIAATEYTVTYSDNINAGPVDVTITDSNPTGNYELTATTATAAFHILRKELTISAAELMEKRYNGQTSGTVKSVTFGGLESTDTLTLDTDYTATAVYNNADAGDGRTATITVTLLETPAAKNYLLKSASFSLTGQSILKATRGELSTDVYIQKKDAETKTLSLKSLLNVDPAYKGTPVYQKPSISGGLGTIVASDHTVTGDTLVYRLQKDATLGTAIIKVVATGLTNYEMVEIFVNVHSTAEKPQETALVISSVGAKTYGDAAFTLKTTGGSGSGQVSYSSSDPTVLTISGDTATILKAGTVTITATKAGDTEYTPTSATMLLTISKKQLIVKAKDKTVTIGEAIKPLNGYIVVGFIKGNTPEDGFTTEPIVDTAAVDSSKAASYDITVRGGTLNKPDCYEITYQKGTLHVVPKAYSITQGALQKVTQGDTATFVSNADFGKFQYVTVDGSYLDPIHYNAYPGSTAVTLSAAYIKSLAPGAHSLSIVSKDGTATTCFTVVADTVYDDVPKTGDTTGNSLWLALALVALAGFAGAQLGKKYLLKRKDI